MPSGRSRKRRDDTPPPIFFLDRGLGRHLVANAIRERGFEAFPMADVYPDGDDELVADDEWIAYAGEQGWIALTKDPSIIRHHTDALAASTLRVFALNNANLTGSQMAERYVRHLNRILRLANKSGPYVYVVGARRVEPRWSPPDS